MGELINLRRGKKAAKRAAEEKEAAANRVAHGTPKQARKLGKAEKRRAEQEIEAHKLDSDKRR